MALCGHICAAEQFFPGERWLDDRGKHINAHGGGILFHEGTYYWFGEQRVSKSSEDWAKPGGVSCYSSTNLYDWKYEGLALAKSDDRRSEIAIGCIIERPKVIYNARTGKFVMWFHLEHRGKGYGSAATAVATSDTAIGPYTFEASHRPNKGQWPIGWDKEPQKDDKVGYLKRDRRRKGQMSRDMQLFVDEQGRAFHIHSAEENYTLHISLLKPDYLDFTDKFIRIFPGGHNEAPALCFHDGKYWMITSGCTGWRPNEARSFVADAMAGPWTQLANPCSGDGPPGTPGPNITWGAQSTFILPVQGKPGCFIAMFDVWRPEDLADSRYLWLPVHFEDGAIKITHPGPWSLSWFDKR